MFEIKPPEMRTLNDNTLALLAYDSVLSSDTLATVCERYELTTGEYDDLLANNSYFRSIREKVHAEAKSVDDDAGFSLRIRKYAEDALPIMEDIMKRDDVSPELKAGVFKSYLSYISSEHKITANGKNGGVGTVVQFVLDDRIRGIGATIEHAG